MPPVRNSNQGRVHLQGYSHYSNHVRKWIGDVNEAARRRIMFPWQKRNKKPTNKTGHNGSSQQAEEDEELDPILTPSNGSSQQAEEDEEEEEEELDPILTPSNGFQQHEAWHANLVLTEDGPYRSSRPVGQSLEPNYLGQPDIQYGEQTWEGNHLNIPTFPEANQFSQTTNTVPSDSIYSAGYSSTFAPSNIYTSALHPSTFHLPNIYSTAADPFDAGPSNIYNPPNHNTQFTITSDSVDMPQYTSSDPAGWYGNSMTPDSSYRQSLEEVWHDNFALHQQTFPTLPEPDPPTTASPCAQPIATARSAPVLPDETAPIAISSPEDDPFMGADWSPEPSEDWL